MRDANPDGHARRTRQNAPASTSTATPPRAGVLGGPTASAAPVVRARDPGSCATSSAASARLVVWYHQPLGLVDAPESGRATVARRYARLTGLPFRPLPHYPGSLSRWVNARVRAGSSFVVELAAGRPTRGTVARHARAVLRLAATLR